MSETARIFIHIGAPKTGTSFLQQYVFPFWPNMEYVNLLGFRNLAIISENKKYLVSNETLYGRAYNRDSSHGLLVDWYGERELIIQGLSRLWPDAQPIVSFRDHVDFILSVYKQYLHEGGGTKLSRWFDIDNDNSEMKRKEFLYMRTVELLGNCFERKPFVFTLGEIEKDLQGLLEKFGKLFGEERPDIDLEGIPSLNIGVRYWQGILLRWLNIIDKKSYTRFKPKGFLPLTTDFTRKHKIDPRYICQHGLKDFSKRQIKFEKSHEQKIRDYYRLDWLAVNEYIRSFVF